MSHYMSSSVIALVRLTWIIAIDREKTRIPESTRLPVDEEGL